MIGILEKCFRKSETYFPKHMARILYFRKTLFMKNRIDFKTCNYFTGMPYVLGFILLPIGLLVIFSPQPVIGAVILIGGIIIVSTHYRMKIDYSNKRYSEYIWLLGLKTGIEQKSFISPEYLFIKKTQVSQTLNSRVSSTTIQKEQYDGFLKFSEDDKVHLMTYDNKKTILKKLREIASQLNLKVVDYAQESPAER